MPVSALRADDLAITGGRAAGIHFASGDGPGQRRRSIGRRVCAIIGVASVRFPTTCLRGRSLCAACRTAYVAPRPRSGPTFPQRQRRHSVERVDSRLGCAPASPRSGTPLRSQHLLSGARYPRVLRTTDRARPHGCTDGMDGGISRARLQHRPAGRIRAVGARGGSPHRGLDWRHARRRDGRIDVRVQHGDAVADRAPAGGASLRTAIRVVRGGSHHHQAQPRRRISLRRRCC